MAAKQWTEEQHKQQAEKIKQWQPWEKSTGATTIDGKARSSQHAYKQWTSRLMKQVRAALKQQREQLNEM